jgi:hypothetical protein
MSQMNEIESKTTAYAKRREELSQVVGELNDTVESLKRKYIGVIKRRVAATAEAEAELRAALEASPHMFERPRSVIIAGVRVGYAKQKGSITWADDEQVVKLIRKHWPDDFDSLVKTEYTPLKTALAKRSAADLKRLDVDVEADCDAVLIKPADSGVDKLVTALLKGAADEAVAA